MDRADFPFSCGASCIGEFGGGESGDDADYEMYANASGNELYQMIKDCVKYDGTKIIFAVTTSNQPWAEELLQEFGFYTSKTVGNTSGSRTIQGWFLPIHEIDWDKIARYK